MAHAVYINGKLVSHTGNALKAMGRVTATAVQGKKVIVSTEEQCRRIGICSKCEFYQKGRCLKCGCFMNLKSRLQTEHCPIGKW